MANSWDQLRQAGAEARARLLLAAAADVEVPVGEITIERGYFSHAVRQRARLSARCARGRRRSTPTEPANAEDAGSVDLYRQDLAARRYARQDHGQGALHHRRQAAGHADLRDRPSAALRRQSAELRRRARRWPSSGVVEVVAVPAGVAVLAQWLLAGAQGRQRAEGANGTTAARRSASSTRSIEQYKDACAKSAGLVARNDGDAEKARWPRPARCRGDLRLPVSRPCADGAAMIA